MGIELIERCVWCGKAVCRLPTGIWTHYYESSGDTHWRCYPDNSISTVAKPAGVTVKLDGSPMETTEQRLRIRIQQLEDRVCILEDEFDEVKGYKDPGPLPSLEEFKKNFLQETNKTIDRAVPIECWPGYTPCEGGNSGHVDDNLPSDSQHD